MFYIKTDINNSMEIKVDIYDDEIYTQCPKCGKEMQVEKEDLIQVLQDGDFASTSIYCEECSKIINKERKIK